MALCPSCGTNNPERAKFCFECGGTLAQPTVTAEERKVVSVLFVDLVGFTARSHDADPEDVRAALGPYHARLKREIERFGGTVEKFIGDAVMAVFGAPVAHEDDAERAARAALRVLDAIGELNKQHTGLDLSIRAAINTGEGLVSLGARLQAGETLVTGDVVNTASRLQEAAPVGSVVVGEITYRSTKDVIDYERLEAVTVKGKPEPIPLWRARSARSRFGVDVDMAPATPFVGRNFELDLLKGTFRRSLREGSVQLITIAGEPGVGKTRLLAELSSFVDDQPELVYWRQGRSLAYGDGLTFWALAEIIKAHSGILESDSPTQAAHKLGAAVAGAIGEERERGWFEARLSPLVGLQSLESSASAAREESFTAWRRFLEGVAERSPLVLVFEDLHWADQALLEFIDHLVDWASGVPLVVVCTARPDLYEFAPGWGGGKRNSNTISLSPLTDSETAQLISALLSQAVLPARIHAALLERAGGNPLYAEEFVRMLADRGILERRGRVLSIDENANISMPETVQALLAARLDTLALNSKALLQDASVVGKVFWPGAVAALSGRAEREVAEGLHDLALKELVRPARASSMEGEQEYSFWHGLVRDVAYSQIPRAARGSKHKAMAAWLEEVSGERVSDQAELLAHHYTYALDLARAAGDEAAARELTEPARRSLMSAGDRAFELDTPRAESYYSRALELFPLEHPGRPAALVGLGHARLFLGRQDAAERDLDEALTQARSNKDSLTQANALNVLRIIAWSRGDTARANAITREAVKLLEGDDLPEELARAYARLAADCVTGDRAAEALEWAERALALSARIGSRTQLTAALTARGGARYDLGDPGAIEDLRAAVEEGLKLGIGEGTFHAYNWLAEMSWLIEGAAPGKRNYEEAIEFVVRRGLTLPIMFNKAEFLRVQFDLGEWDQLVDLAAELLEWSEAHDNSQVEARALVAKTHVLLLRGGRGEAEELQGRLLDLARHIEEPQVLVPALAVSAAIEQARGDAGSAVGLIDQLDRSTRGSPIWRAHHLPTAARTLVGAGKVSRAANFLDGIDVAFVRDRNCLLTGRALVAEARHEHEEALVLFDNAATAWADYGFTFEHGQALLGAARCLLELARPLDAMACLQHARETFVKLGARPSIGEVDSVLRTAARASAEIPNVGL